jgi:hypothetical protein
MPNINVRSLTLVHTVISNRVFRALWVVFGEQKKKMCLLLETDRSGIHILVQPSW